MRVRRARSHAAHAGAPHQRHELIRIGPRRLAAVRALQEAGPPFAAATVLAAPAPCLCCGTAALLLGGWCTWATGVCAPSVAAVREGATLTLRVGGTHQRQLWARRSPTTVSPTPPAMACPTGMPARQTALETGSDASFWLRCSARATRKSNRVATARHTRDAVTKQRREMALARGREQGCGSRLRTHFQAFATPVCRSADPLKPPGRHLDTASGRCTPLRWRPKVRHCPQSRCSENMLPQRAAPSPHCTGARATTAPPCLCTQHAARCVPCLCLG